jgi:hypothetical protein
MQGKQERRPTRDSADAAQERMIGSGEVSIQLERRKPKSFNG